jgi:thiamine biosynthesis lipoprotein
MNETATTFPCFGGTCAVHVGGDGPLGAPADAGAHARRRLREWHDRFTRFDPASELSRLNADPRERVPVRRELALLAAAVADAARWTRGLVDGTLVGEIEAAGYRTDLRRPVPLPLALRLAPARRAAAGREPGPWRELAVDLEQGMVLRPPGLAIDSGGLGKGLFADLLFEQLAGHASVALACAGDVRLGGSAGLRRPVPVEDPFGGAPVHTLVLRAGGVATSGIARRSWLDDAGRVAHHLLDPSTGRPAFTGIVQATAVAPTALEAEVRAKAALLSGPAGAAAWLPHGGVLVFDDGRHAVVPARDTLDAWGETTMAA